MKKPKVVFTDNATELKETYIELEKALKLLDGGKPDSADKKTLHSLRTTLLAKRKIIEAQIKIVRVLDILMFDASDLK